MTEKRILTPGPTHPITIEPTVGRVVVTIAGRTVADTKSALTLREAAYPAVQYIPRADINMPLLERSETASYCPTRAMHRISASLSVMNAGRTRSGLTRTRIRPSQRSADIWRSTLTASTPSTSRPPIELPPVRNTGSAESTAARNQT